MRESSRTKSRKIADAIPSLSSQSERAKKKHYALVWHILTTVILWTVSGYEQGRKTMWPDLREPVGGRINGLHFLGGGGGHLTHVWVKGCR